jgi:hypothetical protein
MRRGSPRTTIRDEFTGRGTAQQRWWWRNPKKGAECQRRYRIRHPYYTATQHRLSKYGVSGEQFQSLLALQGNRCGICGSEFKGSQDHHLDHDHITGKVRGILCRRCNRAIGLLHDDPSILRSAIGYLEGARVVLRIPS